VRRKEATLQYLICWWRVARRWRHEHSAASMAAPDRRSPFFFFFRARGAAGPVGWPALAALSCGRNCDCPEGCGAGLSNGLAAKPAPLASLPPNSTFLSENTSNQAAVLFSQNKPTPTISHQPTEQTVCGSDVSSERETARATNHPIESAVEIPAPASHRTDRSAWPWSPSRGTWVALHEELTPG
jgi:hypothetical protein